MNGLLTFFSSFQKSECCKEASHLNAIGAIEFCRRVVMELQQKELFSQSKIIV